jgi:hypothetical protein
VKLAAVSVGRNAEVMAVDPDGSVSYWFQAADTRHRVGASRWPGPSSGVSGTGDLLPGMAHAAFVVRGSFGTDGRRAAVVFTYGRDGWGGVLPSGTDRLALSDKGIEAGSPAVVRGVTFADDQLITSSCAVATIPCPDESIRYRYWSWDGAGFTLTGRSGPP